VSDKPQAAAGSAEGRGRGGGVSAFSWLIDRALVRLLARMSTQTSLGPQAESAPMIAAIHAARPIMHSHVGVITGSIRVCSFRLVYQ